MSSSSNEFRKVDVKRLTPAESALIDNLRESYKEHIQKSVNRVEKVQQEGKMWLVLSDIHVPGHNKKLLKDIFTIIKDYDVEGIVIAGDFLDMYSLASFNSNSLAKLKDWSLSNEYEMGNKVLDELDEVRGDAKVVFLMGNHEERLDREIVKLDNAKYGDALIDVNRGLKLTERGYTVIKDYPDGFYRIGNEENGIDIMHGTRSNKYPAAATLNDNGGNVMFCHTHRVSTYADQQGVGYNIGCLIDIENPMFQYASRLSRRKWKNGFAVINEDERGNTFVEMIMVKDNNFYFRGIKY